jgi:hypothetical protein
VSHHVEQSLGRRLQHLEVIELLAPAVLHETESLLGRVVPETRLRLGPTPLRAHDHSEGLLKVTPLQRKIDALGALPDLEVEEEEGGEDEEQVDATTGEGAFGPGLICHTPLLLAPTVAPPSL